MLDTDLYDPDFLAKGKALEPASSATGTELPELESNPGVAVTVTGVSHSPVPVPVGVKCAATKPSKAKW